jgi:hypothetical protein
MAERQEPMTEHEYTGPISTMRDSPWLSSEDLEDPSGTGWNTEIVTIEGVMEIRNAQFKGGRSKAKCYAVQFVGKPRMLVLNGVTRETLKEMFGRTVPDWIGKHILLYVKPDVRLAGKTVPGIRIKPAPEPQPKPDRLTAFRQWLESSGLTEADATERLAGRTLDEATEEDWQALRAWAKELKPKESP